MPVVEMLRDFDVSMGRRAVRAYKGGTTYPKVLANHAAKIVAAGAGRVVTQEGGEHGAAQVAAQQRAAS